MDGCRVTVGGGRTLLANVSRVPTTSSLTPGLSLPSFPRDTGEGEEACPWVYALTVHQQK